MTLRLRQAVATRVQFTLKRPTRKLPAKRYCAVSVHGKTLGLRYRLTLEDCRRGEGQIGWSLPAFMLMALAAIAVDRGAAPNLPEYPAEEARKPSRDARHHSSSMDVKDGKFY